MTAQGEFSDPNMVIVGVQIQLGLLGQGRQARNHLITLSRRQARTFSATLRLPSAAIALLSLAFVLP